MDDALHRERPRLPAGSRTAGVATATVSAEPSAAPPAAASVTGSVRRLDGRRSSRGWIDPHRLVRRERLDAAVAAAPARSDRPAEAGETRSAARDGGRQAQSRASLRAGLEQPAQRLGELRLVEVADDPGALDEADLTVLL
jgi:hypothetical protein